MDQLHDAGVNVPPAKRYGPILVRPARASDFELMGQPTPYRTTAMAGEDDSGEVLGIGGISWLPDGRAELFTRLREDKKHEHAVALHIATRRFLQEVIRAGVRHAVATPDPSIKPVAEGWMRALGLRPTGYVDVWEL